MSEATTKNFLGIPVEGYINSARRNRYEQWPLEKLSSLLQEVLSEPRLVALQWRQYTPYFNDGDPCEFSVGELTVQTLDVDDQDETDYDDGFVYVSHAKIQGGRVQKFDYETRDFFEDGPTWPKLVKADKIEELSKNLNHFEDILLEQFGDHAVVTVYKDKIVVDEYEHD